MSKYGKIGMFGAMAALVTPVRGYGGPWDSVPSYRHQPSPKFRPRREKYPGQSTAYLVGAWRPMTAGEIADHNRAVDERKAALTKEATDAEAE